MAVIDRETGGQRAVFESAIWVSEQGENWKYLMYAPMSRFSLPFSMNPSRRTPVVLTLCAGMFCVPNVSRFKGKFQKKMTSTRDPLHLTTCLVPFAQVTDFLGEVIGGLKTMSSCGLLSGAAIAVAARRTVVKKVLKNMSKS
jgi:hypothetical protein